jgi:hypothetical protein
MTTADTASAPVRVNQMEQDWLEFRDHRVPVDACEEQVRDMRDAFYTGSACVMDRIMRSDALLGIRADVQDYVSEQRHTCGKEGA